MAICLVRTTGSASLFMKQTAMFASVMKDSQENTAKWVRTLKGRLGSSSGSSSRSSSSSSSRSTVVVVVVVVVVVAARVEAIVAALVVR